MTKSATLFLLSILFFPCCQSNKDEKILKQSLALAGDNRYELGIVLKHYKNDPLKIKAAKFLISNMPGSFGKNKKIIDISTPFYSIYDSLAKEYDYKMDAERGEKIDSLWNLFSNNQAKLDRLPFQLDLENITAEQLIIEIDLAFKAWKGNVYTRDCTFNEFCEYILPLFKNIKLKDVSSEYFETADVTLSLENTLPEARYAYLCVFGDQQWRPVQWGKIKKDRVTFTRMGKDIIYLPAYYKNHRLIPAGEAFLLDSAGCVTSLQGDGKKSSVSIHQTGGADSYSNNLNNIHLLNGLKIIGYSKDNSTDTLLILSDAIPLESVRYPVKGSLSYNRIMACFRSDTTAVSEIIFYDAQNQIIIPDHIESDIIPFNNIDNLSHVSDLIMASGIKGFNNDRKIWFHFNKGPNIAYVKVAPYIQNTIVNNGAFILYYWDNGWKEAGTQQSTKGFLTFHDVPDNHLYMLRHQQWAKMKYRIPERFFLYKDGEVLWY